MKVPVGHDLASLGSIAKKTPFKDFNHFGDLAHHAGRIFVPLEEGANKPNSIGILDTSLNEIGIHPTPEAKQASWCAAHDRILYTSNFRISESSPVRRYEISSDGKTLKRIADLPLRNHDFETQLELNCIQGGAVSEASKTLWLATGSTGSCAGLDAIWGFDIRTGAFRGMKSIPTSHMWPFILPEVEGITFFPDPASPKVSGRLHVMVAKITDVFGESDNYTLVHYDVENPSDAPRL